MKQKWTALLLALGLTLSLTACGGEADAPVEEESSAVSGESLPEDVDVVESDDVEASSGAADMEQEEPEELEETGAAEVEATPEKEPVKTEVEAQQKPTATKPAESNQKTESKPVQTPQEEPEVKPEPEVEQPAADRVDLTAFYQSLVQTYGAEFPADSNVSDSAELLDSFYPGLTAIETEQVVIYQPMMSSVVCEIVLVEVKNAADVQTVKDICKARIDYQVGDGTRPGGAWYPESMEAWENYSRITAHGNYVMMIAYSGCDAVVSAFNALF